ncbi:amidase family protein [Pseudophaeobacter leonis]|uniref:amidase family protein n=1 Tax=Pseudophaeobacter leonis TaxID=1144477 RepID=UPI0009F5726E|nr:amidase family protein [Pseudophaeobacter leonis]
MTSQAFRLLVSSLAGFFPPEFAAGPMQGFEPMTQRTMRYAAGVSLHQYLARAAAVNTEVRKMSAFFDRYDILLTAATNGPAHPLGLAHLDQEMEFDPFVELLLDLSPFSVPFNASGQPAMTLPVHQTPMVCPLVCRSSAALVKMASCSNWRRNSKPHRTGKPWRPTRHNCAQHNSAQHNSAQHNSADGLIGLSVPNAPRV